MKKICYITTIATTIRAFFIPQLKYLAEHGYDVTVICSPDLSLTGELGDSIKYKPIKIARGVSPMTLNRSIKELKLYFKEENFDIVQYSTPNAAFCAAVASKCAGIKIRNYHLMGLRYLGMSGILKQVFKFIEKITCRLSTNIECITPSNMELAINEGLFDRDKAAIVWNGSTGGVNLNRFDSSKSEEWRKDVRQKLGISDKDFVFGFIGRITRDKGVNEILEAYGGLKNDCKLLIIGSDEGVKTLDEKLWGNSLTNKNIIFYEWVADIEKYYAAIDVLLLPSYREGFGMVIAEAAAVGTPAIVSDIPGPIDVIKDGVTGYRVRVKDSESLQNAMEMLLANPQKCKQMRENCVEFIKQNFDSSILNEKILERKDMLISDLNV